MPLDVVPPPLFPRSTPVSSKAILQRLPLRLYRRLEDIVNRCNHLEWKHFDAGVIKVWGLHTLCSHMFTLPGHAQSSHTQTNPLR